MFENKKLVLVDASNEHLIVFCFQLLLSFKAELLRPFQLLLYELDLKGHNQLCLKLYNKLNGA